MTYWEWDPFESLLNFSSMQLEEGDPLPKGIHSFWIERSENYKITLIVKSPVTHDQQKPRYKPGEYFVNDTKAKLSSPHINGLLTGLSISQVQKDLINSGPDGQTTHYNVDSVDLSFQTDREATYLIDHIANIPNYIWPSSVQEDVRIETSRVYSGEQPLTFKKTDQKVNLDRSCLRMKIGGLEIILGAIKKTKINCEGPGYILYLGNPSDTARRQIRDSISFAFGKPLIYFSHSILDNEGDLIGTRAVSPMTFEGRAWAMTNYPPAPITDSTIPSMLCEEKIERIANSFLSNLSKFNLESLPWRLWYADSAPYFMRAAYYGALIEGLQKDYLENNKGSVSRTIIDKNSYKAARKPIERYIRNLALDETSRAIFINKLNEGNIAPQRIVAERLYSALNLTLGNIEKSAWAKRNDAAHGNPISEEETVPTLRETKVLRVLLNRIVLRLTDGSDHYIDYYSYNFPIRALSDPIPDEFDN